MKNSIAPTAESLSKIKELLWPASAPYPFPDADRYGIRLGFLCRQKREHLMATPKGLFLARDGLLPLKVYFKKNPRPAAKQEHVLIHHSCVEAVPIAWKKAVSYFRAEPTLGREGAPRKKVLISGAVHSALHSLDSFKKEIIQIRKLSRQRSVHLVLPLVFDHIQKKRRVDCFYEHFRRVNYYNEWLFSMFSALGLKFEIIPYGRLFKALSLEEFEFAELNHGKFCSDTLFTHLALSKKAIPLKGFDSVPSFGKEYSTSYFAISAFHGLKVSSLARWNETTE